MAQRKENQGFMNEWCPAAAAPITVGTPGVKIRVGGPAATTRPTAGRRQPRLGTLGTPR